MTTLDRIRNVAIVPSSPSGASGLVTGLVSAADAVASVRCGPVDFASLDTGECLVNLLVDREPHSHRASPLGSTETLLRGVDAALFDCTRVLEADDAVVSLWRHCSRISMPRAVILDSSGLDSHDIESALEELSAVLGGDADAALLPTMLPLLGDDDHIAGLIDVVTGRIADYSEGGRVLRMAEPEHLDLTDEIRQVVLRAIVAESLDDSLVEQLLDGEDVSADRLVEEVAAATARGRICPVLLVSGGPITLGFPEVLETICRAFPSPLEAPLPPVTGPAGEARLPLACDPMGPLCADVLVAETPGNGAEPLPQPALVRILSGTLRSGAIVQSATGRASAGDLVAVTGLAASAGATLCDPSDPLVIAAWSEV